MIFSDKITDKIRPASMAIDSCPPPLPHLLQTAASILSPASQQFTTTSTPEPLNLHSSTSNIGDASSSLPEWTSSSQYCC